MKLEQWTKGGMRRFYLFTVQNEYVLYSKTLR